MVSRNAILPEKSGKVDEKDVEGAKNESGRKYSSQYDLNDKVIVLKRLDTVDKLVKPALRGMSESSPGTISSRTVSIEAPPPYEKGGNSHKEERRKRGSIGRRLSYRDEAPGNTLEDVTALDVSHNDIYENLPEAVKRKRELMAKRYCYCLNRTQCVCFSITVVFVTLIGVAVIIAFVVA